MLQLPRLLRSVFTALKDAAIPVITVPSGTTEPAPEKTFLFSRKQEKQKEPAAGTRRIPGDLRIVTAEKSVFTAFEQSYILPAHSSFRVTDSSGQRQMLSISVKAGSRPLPPGTVKMLDLCKSIIQSPLIS